ncbi:hypothetical protein [Streptomyces sp. NPDC088752]|uniref:hypothetical protein n=1 Tax=Streptomyces sp. NPDC088752 TaxID=3154963 RepID=UPI0034467CEE
MSHADAQRALPGIRKNLVYRGLTQAPGRMCAKVGKYGKGWVVFVGFQNTD